MNVNHQSPVAGPEEAASSFPLLNLLLGLLAIVLAVVLASILVRDPSRPAISSPIEVPAKSPAVSWTRHDLSLPRQIDDQLVELLLPAGEKLEEQRQEHRVTHVKVVDFDKDGVNDIVACDGAGNQVVLVPAGDRDEDIGPVHARLHQHSGLCAIAHYGYAS